jgi:hypothetical protein
MSRGASNASGLGPLGRSLALGAPAVTALTLAAIVGLPPTEPDHELQLLAPSACLQARSFRCALISMPV